MTSLPEKTPQSRCPHGFYEPESNSFQELVADENSIRCQCCKTTIDTNRFGIPQDGICVHCRQTQDLFDRIKRIRLAPLSDERF